MESRRAPRFEYNKTWRERNREHLLAYKKRYHQENKEIENKYSLQRRREKKTKAIEYLGGSCSKCGGFFHPSVYDFHHKNPKEKEFTPSSLMTYSWKRIKEELDKCVLLCANCHRMEHHGNE